MTKFKFDIFEKRFKQKRKTIIKEAANDARNHFIGSFDNEGFTNDSLRAWKRRKKLIRGRKILIGKQGGTLKRSVLIASMSDIKARIQSNLVYSAVHNYGRRAGRGEGFMMPQRKFMGNSNKLEVKTAKRIARRIELIRRSL